MDWDIWIPACQECERCELPCKYVDREESKDPHEDTEKLAKLKAELIKQARPLRMRKP